MAVWRSTRRFRGGGSPQERRQDVGQVQRQVEGDVQGDVVTYERYSGEQRREGGAGPHGTRIRISALEKIIRIRSVKSRLQRVLHPPWAPAISSAPLVPIRPGRPKPSDSTGESTIVVGTAERKNASAPGAKPSRCSGSVPVNTASRTGTAADAVTNWFTPHFFIRLFGKIWKVKGAILSTDFSKIQTLTYQVRGGLSPWA